MKMKMKRGESKKHDTQLLLFTLFLLSSSLFLCYHIYICHFCDFMSPILKKTGFFMSLGDDLCLSQSIHISIYLNICLLISLNFYSPPPPFYCFIIFQCLLISIRPLLLSLCPSKQTSFIGDLRTRKISHSPRSLLGLVLYELYGKSFESVLYGYPVLQPLPSE